MSSNIISGVFDTFDLLKFISSTKFVTSGDIRRKFFEIKHGTLNAKLRKLQDEGLIERKKKAMERAGDDKYEYKLTEGGIKTRNELTNKILHILNPEIKRLLTQRAKKSEKSTQTKENNNELIENILVEFYEESQGKVNETVLNELMEIMRKILTSALSNVGI